MSAPRGILVAIGGGEDKKDHMVVLQRILAEVRGEAERLVIIAGASREPRRAAEPFHRAFNEMGIRYIDELGLQSRGEVEQERTLELIEQADVVFFTGGDQLRLVELLRDSAALDLIRKRYEDGAVVAGTSAGAAAMSQVLLSSGSADEGLSRGNVKTDHGLGLLPHTVIDTHFVQRGRFARLLEVVTHDPSLTGLGISEDTAIIVREGRHLEVVGSDNVIVFDGAEILHTNARDANRGEALIVARAVVHALAQGCHYDLETRELRVPTKDTVAIQQPMA